MVGFRNIRQFVQAQDDGKTFTGHFRKVPALATVGNNWADLSMAAGNPVPNYYAASPLQATVLESFKGIFHGDDKAPSSKHLSSWGLLANNAKAVGQYKLMDYVLYYPFVDGDTTDAQDMDNTQTIPRYTDGNGLKVMMVIVGQTSQAGQFTFDYINQDGVLKTSPIVNTSTTLNGISNIATSQVAQAAGGQLFLPLADGDTGIRSIESVTFSTVSGGLFALVLVKPLDDLAIYEANTMNETNFIRQKMALPTIEDGAYLGLVCNAVGNIAGVVFTGYLNFTWS